MISYFGKEQHQLFNRSRILEYIGIKLDIINEYILD